MLFASVYASIAYFITEQPPEPERFLKFILVFICVSIVADGFGIFLGTIVNPIVSCFICFYVDFNSNKKLYCKYRNIYH